MNNNDAYFTIASFSEGIFKDKGSKFIALAFPVSSEEEIKQQLIHVKKKYHDARHHCYAYKLGIGTDRYRINDDGEPSGTAGKPIYGQLLSNRLSDVLIVVVRYFGGTLLGTGGLINAYKNAAYESIQNAKIIETILKATLTISFNYELMSTVMKIVKDNALEIKEQDFRESCKLRLGIRLSEVKRINAQFENIYGIEVIP